MVGADSRQRILDAALALMSEHGVAGTSMRMLAGAADLNVATLYHHFPSKADLLHAVLEQRRYLERLGTERPEQRTRGVGQPQPRAHDDGRRLGVADVPLRRRLGLLGARRRRLRA